jgi:photosystem II stability/assembly factor-like uncharacterized protein
MEEAGSVVYEEDHPSAFYDAIAFWDDQNGIAMGDPTDSCLSIILTSDGGDSWTKIPCDRLPPSANNEAAFAASNSNIALIGDHAWIVSGGGRARVFHSPDRGETWEVFDTPIIQGGKMTGILRPVFMMKREASSLVEIGRTKLKIPKTKRSPTTGVKPGN